MTQALFIALMVLVVVLAAAPPLVALALAVTALAWKGDCPHGMLVAGLLPPAVYGAGVVVLTLTGGAGATTDWLLYALPFLAALALMGAALAARPGGGTGRALSVTGLVAGAVVTCAVAVIAVRSVTG